MQLIITYSTKKLSKNSLIDSLDKNHFINKIRLKPINKILSRKIIENIVASLDEKSVTRIINFINPIVNGNPGYIIESLRQLVNNKILFPVMNRWESDFSKLNKINWKSMEDVVLNKIQSLKKYEFNILTYAIIYNYEFDLDLFFKICNEDKDNIVTAIDYFINQDIIKSTIYNKKNFYFINQIYQNLLINKLQTNKKKEIHFKISMVLEDEIKLNDSVEKNHIAAYHFKKSGNMKKAFEYYYNSGLFFIKLCGYKTTLSYFEQALEIYKKYNLTDNIKFENMLHLIKKIKDFYLNSNG